MHLGESFSHCLSPCYWQQWLSPQRARPYPPTNPGKTVRSSSSRIPEAAGSSIASMQTARILSK